LISKFFARPALLICHFFCSKPSARITRAQPQSIRCPSSGWLPEEKGAWQIDSSHYHIRGTAKSRHRLQWIKASSHRLNKWPLLICNKEQTINRSRVKLMSWWFRSKGRCRGLTYVEMKRGRAHRKGLSCAWAFSVTLIAKMASAWTSYSQLIPFASPHRHFSTGRHRLLLRFRPHTPPQNGPISPLSIGHTHGGNTHVNMIGVTSDIKRRMLSRQIHFCWSIHADPIGHSSDTTLRELCINQIQRIHHLDE
jgi:hypothetical protein